MKRIIVILFFVCVVALLYSDGAWSRVPFEASAQGRGAAKPAKYGKFTHKSHTGDVKVPGTDKMQKLDCAYCHAASKDKPRVETYPNTKYPDTDKEEKTTHSSCTECHAFTGRQAVASGVFPTMCLICHSSNQTASAAMKKNLRGFPNQTVVASQFGDLFSHKTHKGYLDKFNCSECHLANQEPVTVVGVKFAKGEKMSSPEHPDCFKCHSDKKTKNSAEPYAADCQGCHLDYNNPKKGQLKKGQEPPAHAVSFFVRQVVEPVAPNKPFNHEDHSSDGAVKGVSINNGIKGNVSNQTKECMSCHLTGMTAEKRADFFYDAKTKANQPVINGCKDCVPVNGCLNCHERYTSQKIAGVAKLEMSKCTYCHSIPMMKERAASGLPPASHLAAAPGTTPSTTPATPKPETKPETKPAPKPEKPEAKPAPAASAPKTEPPKAEVKPAPKPEAKPETKQEAKAEMKPATPVPKPEPLKQAAATPAPAANNPAPASPPAAAGSSQQKLPGALKLGDLKVSQVWGQDAKWGVVDFDHSTHIKPTYAERCEICHHTNKDAKNEVVAKCISCHLESGNAKNPKSKGGEEVDVKLAYHGDANNTSNNAGCIVCHQRFKENKADANAPTKCAECHALKGASLRPGGRWASSEKLMMTAAYETWYPQARKTAAMMDERGGSNDLSWAEQFKAVLMIWLTLESVI